jgi:hypothetical protein
MNRRSFLGTLVAMAVAPIVKVGPARGINRLRPEIWQGPLKPYGGFSELKITPAQAECIRKIAVANSESLKALSYGQGGFVRPLHK